jgi:hypothetical protein
LQISTAGDIDDDGLDDILMLETSPTTRVHVFLGASLGTDTEILASESDYIITGTEQFGRSLASAGDIDGDGLDDIIIGNYSDDSAGTNAGAAFVFLGSSFGAVRERTDDEADYKLTGAYENDNAGYAVAGAGDVDGDGLDDVIIGAPNNPDGDLYAGCAYIVLGNRFADDRTLDLLVDADYQLFGDYEYDYRGQAVAGVGDVDGDGLDDVAIGSLRDPDSHSHGSNGTIYIVLGADLGTDSTISLSEADQRWTGEESSHAGDGESFRQAISGGDINGDGLSDVVIGARYVESQSGKAYIVLGQ